MEDYIQKKMFTVKTAYGISMPKKSTLDTLRLFIRWKEVLPDNEAAKSKEPETLPGHVCPRDAYNDYIKKLLKKPG